MVLFAQFILVVICVILILLDLFITILLVWTFIKAHRCWKIKYLIPFIETLFVGVIIILGLCWCIYMVTLF